MDGSAHGLCCWKSVFEPSCSTGTTTATDNSPWCAQLFVIQELPSLSGLVFFPIFGVFGSSHDRAVDKLAWFDALEQMEDVWVMSWETVSYRSFWLGHEVSAH